MRDSARRFHLIVPGPLDQRTGGYLYDARVVEELRGAGWAVEVHSVPGRFPDPDEVARSGLDEVLRAVDDGDLVVIDGLAMGGLPEVVARHASRVGLVALVHHPLADETGRTPEEERRFFASERSALESVRGVIVTSPFTARRLTDFDVAPDRVRVVVPGTDPAPTATGPGEGEPPCLVCVASLSPRKGHDVLVEALDRVRDLPWICVCAGSTTRDQAFASGVLESVREKGLSERVIFRGELEPGALEEVYTGASLFVLPSHYEGYGMAYAEALARGIPVVGTTGGAIPDTVPDGTGVLTEPGDAGALADTLRSLLSDAARRGALAAEARRHAEALPTWRAQAERFGAAVTELSSHV